MFLSAGRVRSCILCRTRPIANDGTFHDLNVMQWLTNTSHLHADHSHAPASFNTAFAVGVTLNAGYVVFEAIFGFLGHSLALVADAGHNLSDVLGLFFAWCAGAMAKSLPTKRETYGLRGTSILAALFNAIFLLVSVGAIAWEALRRFQRSRRSRCANRHLGFAARYRNQFRYCADVHVRPQGRSQYPRRFSAHGGGRRDLGGVVIAGLAILFTGRHWIDPVVSLLICAVIIWGTWDLLRESVNLALQGVPKDVDLDAVER